MRLTLLRMGAAPGSEVCVPAHESGLLGEVGGVERFTQESKLVASVAVLGEGGPSRKPRQGVQGADGAQAAGGPGRGWRADGCI